MKLLSIDYGENLVVFDRYYSLEELKAVVQAREGSYADEITERIHYSLLGGTRDLRAEYHKYYEIEYETFGQFLFWRYLIEKDFVEEIELQMTASTFVGYGKNMLYLMDYDSVDDDLVKEMMNTIFSQLGETIYEDSN